jgi:hypothetical protein
LAIITMQTMPQASWPQRPVDDPAAADWTAGDSAVIVFRP